MRGDYRFRKVSSGKLFLAARIHQNNKLVSFQSSPTTYEGDHEAVEKLFLSAENAKKAQLQQGQKK